MDVVVDIDQTLFPLLRAMKRVPGGEGVQEDCPVWHGLEAMCTRPLDEVIFSAIQPGVACEVGLYPGAKETIDLLETEGFSVTLATHRDSSCEDVTREFLEFSGLGHLPLFVGAGVPKTKLLSLNGILVDDAPHLLQQAYNENQRAVSLLHAYNQETIKNLRLPHASDWNELQEVIFQFLRA